MSKAKDYEARAAESYPEIKEIKKDLSSLKSNTVDLARHVQSDGAEQAAVLTEKSKDYYNQLKEKGTREFHKMEDAVRDKPARSVAFAFAAGVVASLLLARR